MIPERAEVVIIGGGIIGCSIAYHLAKLGITDVVLLERRQLCCGTTWHSVGSVAELRASRRLTDLARYTAELYRSLEEETGQATGYKRTGSIMLALNRERLLEAERTVNMARVFGQEAAMLTVGQIRELCPQVETSDVLAGLYLPSDGRTNPIDTVQALVRGARRAGVKILENVTVDRMDVQNGKARGVFTDKGFIGAETVVFAGGMWGREFGARHGVSLPLQAAEHFYAVTENVDGLRRTMPFIRVPDESAYYKEDAGKLLFGCLEKHAKPWALDGMPADFCFDALPEDLEHFMPTLEAATRRFPLLENTGIQLFFNGPESFTPDGNALLGETPELENFFVACGMNTMGIMLGGGIGKLMAEWIKTRQRPQGIAEFDVVRLSPFQAGRNYMHDRTVEALGVLYDYSWPNRQHFSARGARRLALNDRHMRSGAVMGEAAGWEIPLFYDRDQSIATLTPSFDRQNWVPLVARECEQTRRDLMLFDHSACAKLEISGTAARAALARVSATAIDSRLTDSIWLTHAGTFHACPKILPLPDERFLLIGAPGTERLHTQWLERHEAAERQGLIVRAVTSGLAVLRLAGPRAEQLLADAIGPSWSPSPVVQAQIGYAPVTLARALDMNVPAWLLITPAEFVGTLVEGLATFSEREIEFGGTYALDAMRIEAGRPGWPEEMSDNVNPLELGLMDRLDGERGSFLGSEPLLSLRSQLASRRLVHIRLLADEGVLYGQEMILRNGEPVGLTTTGAWSSEARVPVALGFVNAAHADDAWFDDAEFHVGVAGEEFRAICRAV